ncbi:ExbD/TolR family protein [Nitrosococcus watsonii]|uniref:Biopolymer transport protein ExbD/TolR n=1 Tax=Nitrosococcus watsoni (strain C-113) TaxID=105559 RepID=D8KA92_NITWC|nr:biopolymer transporter ExbD [Nitrosococcus watsonii]ADJ27407.1 Biopolymer transport protein ExbD/TolR [Nitrosococcus watsonii C-113]
MNIHPARHNQPEINLTPLIDVVFLLLIFFMVSTSFSRESALKVDLPEAATHSAERRNDTPLHIEIDKKDKIAINGKRLINNQPATLMTAMKAAAGNRKQPQVIISADAKTDYQSIVTAMDVVQQLGFKRLSLATARKQNNP